MTQCHEDVSSMFIPALAVSILYPNVGDGGGWNAGITKPSLFIDLG